MKKSAFNIALFILIMGVCGADEDKDGVKTVSVMEGRSVTLDPNTTIKGITRIQWKFGDEQIAVVHPTKKSSSYPSERFKHRLKLNDQTGSLTINNTTITDSGDYNLQIDHKNGLFEQIFNVIVHGSGLSPGATAGIVVPLLVLFGAAGAFYYRHRICDLKRLLVTMKNNIRKEGNDHKLYIK